MAADFVTIRQNAFHGVRVVLRLASCEQKRSGNVVIPQDPKNFRRTLGYAADPACPGADVCFHVKAED